MRPFLLATILRIFVTACPAAADNHMRELVPPLHCLAGSWGESSQIQWRVQLGAFNDRTSASRFADRLRAKGFDADEYIGAWMVRDDREPIVVVSPEQPSREMAARMAKRYGAAAPGAFVRRYQVWR